jgi:hypothetical protein
MGIARHPIALHRPGHSAPPITQTPHHPLPITHHPVQCYSPSHGAAVRHNASNVTRGHGGQETGAGVDKDPAEQEMLARGIGDELTEIFVRFVRGELDFAETTFAAYDVLEDLHVIASGEYELEEDGDIVDEYTEAEATEEQEELAQEPSRG